MTETVLGPAVIKPKSGQEGNRQSLNSHSTKTLETAMRQAKIQKAGEVKGLFMSGAGQGQPASVLMFPGAHHSDPQTSGGIWVPSKSGQSPEARFFTFTKHSVSTKLYFRL